MRGRLPERPGSVHPDGDHHRHLDPEPRFGTLGPPREPTPCAFGAPLTAGAEAELTALLGEPVRRRDSLRARARTYKTRQAGPA